LYSSQTVFCKIFAFYNEERSGGKGRRKEGGGKREYS
jgi:hypothetical protein